MLTQITAWAAYDLWIEKGGAVYSDEPLGLDVGLRELTDQSSPAPKEWVDAYLAAFCRAASLTLVTFEKALGRRADRAVLLTCSA